jgi:hypothetical protein
VTDTAVAPAGTTEPVTWIVFCDPAVNRLQFGVQVPVLVVVFT